MVQPPNTLAADTLYDLAIFLMDEVQPNQHVTPDTHLIDAAVQTDAIIFDDQPRPDVDEMIVVDNSGSMADFDKLESAQNAARAFADRRRAGDMIGLSVFANGANTPYPLTTVSNNEVELTQVKNQINGMGANGKTALGSGLLEAKNQLDSFGNDDHPQQIVLLSDGMENVSPCWDTSAGHEDCMSGSSIQSDFTSDNGCPAIKVDTVTIGPDDASWIPLLADVAEQTCGHPYNATDDNNGGGLRQAAATQAATLPTYFPQTLANSLADIYQTIADDNTRQQRFWEEGGQPGTTVFLERDIAFPAGLPEVTLAVNWSSPTADAQIQLFRPSGVAVQALDPDAHIKEDGTHTIFRLTTPESGTWSLQVLLSATSPEGQEYFITASANTDPAMILTLGLPPSERNVGATMPIYAVLSDQVGTIKDATVEFHVRRPGGLVEILTGYDNGTNGDHYANDGVYTAQYAIGQSGNHQIKAISQGKDNSGEAFRLYQMRHFQVEERPLVAYIWDTDSATASAYQKLLEQNNLRVRQIEMSKIIDTDFANYDLVIIGPDTGKDAVWGSPKLVQHLAEGRRKIVGLGDGGHAFFGQLSLDIGYNNGTPSTDTSVNPFDFTHPIWQTPFDLAVTGLVDVYTKPGSDGVAVWGNGVDVVWLASDPPNSTPLWLALEADRYLIWGFNQGPKAMTVNGKALFVNTVWFMVE
ncbi:MAG: VWA domain-containing protein [Chloroflexota bacterium]